LITAIVKYAQGKWQLINVPLAIVIMSLDGLDGIVARARGETSLFGAVFDIAADRIIEITIWITLAAVDLVSVWIPIIIVVRGVLIDILRKEHSDKGHAPFSIMKTKIGNFLVASREMRFLIGFLKFVTFPWLLLLVPFSTLWPEALNSNHFVLQMISNFLIYTTVAVCLLRGLPVIVESIK
jgi:CDP-diacylglycerol--glycerol-3-phosphate 3-phosphatidyltransferase